MAYTIGVHQIKRRWRTLFDLQLKLESKGWEVVCFGFQTVRYRRDTARDIVAYADGHVTLFDASDWCPWDKYGAD